MTRCELLLTQLAEECAEVAKRCSKAVRFSLEERQFENPIEKGGSKLNNGERISEELNDLVVVAEMLVVERFIPDYIDPAKRLIKISKVEKFMEYSVEKTNKKIPYTTWKPLQGI